MFEVPCWETVVVFEPYNFSQDLDWSPWSNLPNVCMLVGRPSNTQMKVNEKLKDSWLFHASDWTLSIAQCDCKLELRSIGPFWTDLNCAGEISLPVVILVPEIAGHGDLGQMGSSVGLRHVLAILKMKRAPRDLESLELRNWQNDGWNIPRVSS
jgi:hypothetical protein